MQIHKHLLDDIRNNFQLTFTEILQFCSASQLDPLFCIHQKQNITTKLRQKSPVLIAFILICRLKDYGANHQYTGCIKKR